MSTRATEVRLPVSEAPDTEIGAIQPAHDGRRAEILEAALEVFAERGYDGGTMRDIAARVGVTEPALYRHFASKEDLFLALLDLTAGRARAEVFALLDAADASRIRESILAVMADRRAAARGYGPALRTVLVAAAHNPAFLDAYRDAIAEPMRDQVARTVVRVDRHLGIHRSEAEVTACVRALMSIAVGTLVTSTVLGDAPEEATADAIVRIMGWEQT